MKYSAVHWRLRNHRGRADAHQCVSCDRQAAHWAYDHSDPNERIEKGMPFSEDLERYRPMCPSCHRFVDAAKSGKSACGTDAGYYRHRHQSTPQCQPCKDAHAAATYARYARRREVA